MNQLPTATPQAKTPARVERDQQSQLAREYAGFDKMLKFKKGRYSDSDGTEYPLGAEFIAHPEAWTMQWICFIDGKVIDRKVYPTRGPNARPPLDRSDLNHKDGHFDDGRPWDPGLDGRPADPWVLQSLLPVEEPKTGDFLVFTASSFGGKRAIGDLVTTYNKRAARQDLGPPVIKIGVKDMPTKRYGAVPRPYFEIIGFDSGGGVAVDQMDFSEAGLEKMKRDEMNDDIPF